MGKVVIWMIPHAVYHCISYYSHGRPTRWHNSTFKCTIQLLTLSMTILLVDLLLYVDTLVCHYNIYRLTLRWMAILPHYRTEQVTKVNGQIVTKSALCAFVKGRHLLNAGCIMWVWASWCPYVGISMQFPWLWDVMTGMGDDCIEIEISMLVIYNGHVSRWKWL